MADDPDLTSVPKRKRKPRRVLSCNDCRRRKLKCNRELPCNRCINGGVSHNCVYGWNGSSLPLGASLIHSPDELQQPELHVSQPSEIGVPQSVAPSTDNTVYSKTSPVAEGPRDERVEQLEQRVASLEAHLLSLVAKSEGQSQSHKPQEPNPSGQHENYTLVGLFKGCKYRTFFYGPTSPLTLVVHVRLLEVLFSI